MRGEEDGGRETEREAERGEMPMMMRHALKGNETEKKSGLTFIMDVNSRVMWKDENF